MASRRTQTTLVLVLVTSLAGCAQQPPFGGQLDAVYRIDTFQCEINDVRRPIDLWLFETRDACALADRMLTSPSQGCDVYCDAQLEAAEMLDGARVSMLRTMLYPAEEGEYVGEYDEEWCGCSCWGEPYQETWTAPVVQDLGLALDREACLAECEQGNLVGSSTAIEEMDDVVFHVTGYGDGEVEARLRYAIDDEPLEQEFTAHACFP